MRHYYIILHFLLIPFTLKAEFKATVYPEFYQLKKITVGPDDQLDSSLDINNTLLAFTKRAGMTSQLQIRDFKTGEIKDLISQTGDSIQAKFNRKGQIVFTYFKFNSIGDICWSSNPINFYAIPLIDSQIKCLGNSNTNQITERSQGFWHNDNEIIFLEKRKSTYYIIKYNIQNSTQLELTQSQSPIVSPFGVYNGKYIVFSEVINRIPQIIIMEIDSKKKNFVPPRLLPGISGLLNLSENEDTLYFSHYISDSNKNGIIDGNDNSVIWRLNIKSLNDYFKVSHRGELKLQQLTPMDYNCSYPFSQQNKLFVTCAFQGSLDIYQLPEEGIVPKNWDSKTLDESFITSRTYQDRILLLNEKKFQSNNSDEIQSLNQSLMYIHILSEDYEAAQFYLDKIKNSKNKDTLNSIEILLKALNLEKGETSNITSLQFKASIINLLRELQSIPIKEPLKSLITGFLSVMIKREVESATLSKLISNKNNSLEYWLYFRLMKKKIPQTINNVNLWIPIYKKIITSTSLNLESKIFYSYDSLDYLSQLSGDARKSSIIEIKNSISENDDISSLFENELHILELINGTDDKTKLLAFQKIDKLLTQFKKNYFLRKAINIRCIRNFLFHQEFKNLNIIAANWIRDTPKISTEFSYSRQVVLRTALELAYGYWQNKKSRLAADYFFQSLSLTDDLESHSGYINTMTEIGQSKNMMERLEYLSNHGTIPDGSIWLELMILLSETNSEKYIKNLDIILKKISELRPELNDPIKYLIIGFIYLEKAQFSQVGVEINNDDIKFAHQNLILASDLSRENPRIQASALTNLALLHLWSQNYGQSVRFWELRKNLGLNEDDKSLDFISFHWFYSQALFLNNQIQTAAEVINSIPSYSQTPEIIERSAFYLSASERFEKAIENYLKLETFLGTDFEKALEPSRSKIRLSKAYVLFKLQRFSEAQSLLNKILLQKFDKKITVVSRYRKIPYEPERLENLIQGFLAQMGSDADRIIALKRRLELLEDDLPSLIQTQVRLAELLNFSDINSSINYMQLALKNCKKFSEENGYIGQTVLKTLINYLVHGLLNKEIYSRFESKEIKFLVGKSLESFSKQQEISNLITLKNEWHLKYLWELYRLNVINENLSLNWEEELMKSPLSLKILQEDSNALNEIKSKISKIQVNH